MGSGARNTPDVIDGPLTIAELREAAGPATVVYLAATGEGGLALILRPKGAPVEAVELEDLTMAAAMELTAALEYAVDKPAPAVCVEVCERLWLTAMARLLPKLRDAREVVLIPGGALAGLPWHAAKLPGRSGGYVLDELAISYMPNIRSLPVTRKAWENMPRRMRALAVEVPKPTGSTALPATANEVAAVQAHDGVDFPVTLLSGAEATARRLRDAMAQHELIHFAGHAFADPNDPLAGALMLVHGEYLTVRELMASGIGVGRFAVLSACETARVDDLMSDEMVSFPTALMQCGFSGVVGTLWRVADRPTSRLMEAFYEQWRGNRVSPRQALRAAQQSIRDQRRSTPLTWASFVYVGPLSPQRHGLTGVHLAP
jgi:CHAT domain-containing protein